MLYKTAPLEKIWGMSGIAALSSIPLFTQGKGMDLTQESSCLSSGLALMVNYRHKLEGSVYLTPSPST